MLLFRNNDFRNYYFRNNVAAFSVGNRLEKGLQGEVEKG